GACAVLLTAVAAPGRLLQTDAVGLGMLVLCALHTLVAYGTFSEALAHWEASRVGAVLALTPVVTIAAGRAANAFWPTMTTAATISPAGLLGAGLVVLGALLTALGQRAAELPQPV